MLEQNVVLAVENLSKISGDILVFLPGKAEIFMLYSLLSKKADYNVIPLHANLSLNEQHKIFEPADRKKIILSTNVAETSITIPGIKAVIDSGLVRQTRYCNGRGYLTLVPIAKDSASQRAGRAGRIELGICIRLWSKKAILNESTIPEVHRESLTPLLLASAACGETVNDLDFYDELKAHAVDASKKELLLFKAIKSNGKITDRGKKLFGIPLEPHLSSLLIQAEKDGNLEDIIDLVSVLSVKRPFFKDKIDIDTFKKELLVKNDDVSAFIAVFRKNNESKNYINKYALKEAVNINNRLKSLFKMSKVSIKSAKLNLKKIAETAMKADPLSIYIARKRKGRVFWSNGGTEVLLSDSSLVNEKDVEAIIAFESRFMGIDRKRTKVLVTCAMPVKLKWLVENGFGEKRFVKAKIENNSAVAVIEIVYAQKVLIEEIVIPNGDLAVSSILYLFLNGLWFKKVSNLSKSRISACNLLKKLLSKNFISQYSIKTEAEHCLKEYKVISFENWVKEKLNKQNIESGDDLELILPEDLTYKKLPDTLLEWIEKKFPNEINIGDAKYVVDTAVEKREVLITKISGSRKTPPKLNYLPDFLGFKIKYKEKNNIITLRG